MKHGPASVSSWGRRDLFKVAAAAAIPASAPVAAESADQNPSGLVDSNVSLFRWPLRRLPCDETAALVAKMRGHGVTQAWTGSFEGLLQRDLGSVNARLAEECRRQGGGVLVPFGSVNPALTDWEDDLRRCAEEHRMPGIRLHPGYHGYGLDHPGLARLLRMAAGRGLLVQLVSVMEDRRTMHPLLQVDPPGLEPLAGLVKETPGLRLELLGLKGPPSPDLWQAGEVCLEISMIEGVGGVENLLAKTPADRVLFGSHAPLFYFESSWLKLKESSLNSAQLDAVLRGNAQRLLALP